MEEKQLNFYGGRLISFIPILMFVAVAVYIAITMNEVTIQGMWVGILIGIIIAFFFAKNKEVYGETIIKGMSARVALVPVAAWIFAGIFATVMRSSGMVDGILWLAVKTGTILNGVAGWMADLSILVILLSAGIYIMTDGGV
jgi:hypothetical protein